MKDMINAYLAILATGNRKEGSSMGVDGEQTEFVKKKVGIEK